MYIKTINLKGFRTYKNFTSFTFSPKYNAIVGLNGSGKSNLLLAINFVLCHDLIGYSHSDYLFKGDHFSNSNETFVEIIFITNNILSYLPGTVLGHTESTSTKGTNNLTKGTNNTTKDTTVGASTVTEGKGANFTAMECTMGKGANFTATECTTKDITTVGTGAVGASTVTEKIILKRIIKDNNEIYLINNIQLNLNNYKQFINNIINTNNLININYIMNSCNILNKELIIIYNEMIGYNKYNKNINESKKLINEIEKLINELEINFDKISKKINFINFDNIKFNYWKQLNLQKKILQSNLIQLKINHLENQLMNLQGNLGVTEGNLGDSQGNLGVTEGNLENLQGNSEDSQENLEILKNSENSVNSVNSLESSVNSVNSLESSVNLVNSLESSVNLVNSVNSLESSVNSVNPGVSSVNSVNSPENLVNPGVSLVKSPERIEKKINLLEKNIKNLKEKNLMMKNLKLLQENLEENIKEIFNEINEINKEKNLLIQNNKLLQYKIFNINNFIQITQSVTVPVTVLGQTDIVPPPNISITEVTRSNCPNGPNGLTQPSGVTQPTGVTRSNGPPLTTELEPKESAQLKILSDDIKKLMKDIKNLETIKEMNFQELNKYKENLEEIIETKRLKQKEISILMMKLQKIKVNLTNSQENFKVTTNNQTFYILKQFINQFQELEDEIILLIDVIEIKEEYRIAIEQVLGSKLFTIIVSKMEIAKQFIQFIQNLFLTHFIFIISLDNFFSSVTVTGPTANKSTGNKGTANKGTMDTTSTDTEDSMDTLMYTEDTVRDSMEATFGAGTKGTGAVGPSTVTGDTVTKIKLIDCIEYNEMKKIKIEEMKLIMKMLLKDFNLVSNSQIALKLLTKNQNSVIPTGEIYYNNGIVTGGYINLSNSILTNYYKMKNMEKKYNKIEMKIKELNKELEEINKKQEEIKLNYSQIKDKYNQSINQYNSLHITLNNLQHNEEILKMKLQNNKTKIERMNLERNEELNLERNEELNMKLTNLKLEKKDLINSILTNTQLITQYDTQINELKQNIQNLKSKQININEQFLQYNLENSNEEIMMEIMRLENELKQLQNQLIEENNKITSNNYLINSLTISINEYKNELNCFDTKILEMMKNNFITQHDIILDKLSKINLECDGMEYMNKIDIKEYETLKNEFQQLQEQKNHILNSKQQILYSIHKLKKTKEENLMEMIEKMNNELLKIFQYFVPNGFIKLVLIQNNLPENMNEKFNGLDIKVSFNNTNETNINLLSGGQKSLILLTFILALNKLRPAPFYLLDEVDSALDEHYRLKLAKFLSKLNTQIILTTFKEELLMPSEVFYEIKNENGISYSKEITLNKAIEIIQEPLKIN